MGRITRIELDNFKSYAGKQVIGPFKNFTAIIGPNGSGKSNLMDAACFVFGVAARHLRSDKLKDLVWHVVGKDGSAAAARALPLPPKSASVSLVYVPDEGEMRGVPGGTEVTFARSITSAGSSVYRINGAEKTWEAYSAALEEINIVTKARNFLVFQGDVESLANKDEKALLQHLEVFCGSAELKEPYDASWKEFMAARDATNEKRIAVNNSKLERKALRAEKEEADAYSAKVAAREAQRTQFALWKLYHLEARIARGEDALAGARGALTVAAKDEDEAGAKLAELSKALAKHHKDAGAKEKAVAAAAKASLKADTAVEDLKMRIASTTKRQGELVGARKKAASAAAEQEEEVAKLEGEIAALQEKLAALDAGGATGAAAKAKGKKGGAAAVAAAPAVVLDEANRVVYNALKAQERQQTADTRQELEALQREQGDDESALAKLRETLEALATRRGELQREAASFRERAAQLSAAHARAVAERKEKLEEAAAAKSQLEADSARHAELAGELEEVKNALAAHKDARKRSDNERKLEAAVEDLKRLFPGVRGRFVELVSPTAKKFNLAVTVALGKHMDAVVVNSQATAFEAIAWLRDNKVRPMTFIPLDKVTAKEPEDRLSTFVNRNGSHFRFARDIIKHDPELEAAVLFAAGTTVVCDTMADAQDLGYKRNLGVKCVTLDGTVIAKNGNMTGGVSTADKELASAGRWDEKEIKSIQARRDALLQEEEGLRRRLARSNKAGEGASLHTLIEDLTNALATNGARIGVVNAELERVNKRLKELDAEVATIDKSAAENQPAFDEVSKRTAARGAKLAALTTAVNGIADGVFGAFCAKLGLESIRSYEVAVVEKAEGEAKQRRELSDMHTKLTTKLEYTKSSNRTKLLADIDARIAETAKALVELKAEEAAAQRASELAQQENARAAAELTALRASAKEREADREAAAKAKRAAGERKAAVAKEVTSLESALERSVSERHDELLKCQMEEVALPFKLGGGGGGGAAAGGGGGGKKAGGGGRGQRGSSTLMDEDGEEEGEDEDPRGTGSDGEEDDDSEPGGKRRKAAAGGRGKAHPAAAAAAAKGKGRGSASSSATGDGGSGGGVFSQTDVTMATSEDTGGGLKEAAEAADARRSERIDFSALDADGQEIGATAAVIEERSAAYERRIHDMEVELAKLKPNMKAGAALEEVEARLKAEIAAYDAAKEASEAASKKYHAVKHKREKLLTSAFEAVSHSIGDIYREMTVSQLHPLGGQAAVTLLSPEEPFDPNDGGIRYSVSPPGKKYNEISALSGGERTIAALALLFALQFYRPSPFLIMDEVDAALDPTNVQRVTSYLRGRALGLKRGAAGAKGGDDDRGEEEDDTVQILVISLKDSFYEHASSLVGVYRDQALHSSRTLTLDVDQFPETV